MSRTTEAKKALTIPNVMARKGGQPLVCLTAYTAPMAEILDDHVDIMLVGDSVGMVLYGMDSTLGVSLEMMIRHGKAVTGKAPQSMVIIDMPFGSYEESPEQAFRNAARLLKETGADGVKMEGGERLAPTVAFLVSRGVPVMGHVGLTPQAVNTLGGYKARGRDSKEWQKIMGDAKAIAEAGAFSIVIEGVAEQLAREITEVVAVPTIGIGASVECDGQVLVTEDMLGLGTWAPKFVKQYADLSGVIGDAVRAYSKEVREREFPGEKNIYKISKKD